MLKMTVPKMNCEWIHWSIIQNWRRKNKTKTKQKTKTTENRTPSVQRRNNLYNLQWKRNLYRWIPKAFQGRVTHDRKCLQSLKQKKPEQNMLSLTILSTRYFHSVQCLLKQGETAVSCLGPKDTALKLQRWFHVFPSEQT